MEQDLGTARTGTEPGTDHEPVPAQTIKGATAARSFSVRHIGDQVREWTTSALERVAARDPFRYDVGLVTLPTPAPGGGLGIRTAYVFTLFLPSALIGKPPYSVAKIISDDPNQDEVQKTVWAAVHELRTVRTNDLQKNIR